MLKALKTIGLIIWCILTIIASAITIVLCNSIMVFEPSDWTDFGFFMDATKKKYSKN